MNWLCGGVKKNSST